ncbi:hypothetical protein Clacol_007426 [Clathrus columnatus]|uniref:Uncharacterized protein n=1 Tax=Clathrus columnatus TaxID=1419009 RepID=A0AAV5AJY7_9AGAM|nr:hypothetical protein Clacol_007426 [Clathrus columnatus]
MSHPSPPFLHQLKAYDSQLPFSRPPTPHATPLKIGFYGLGNMGYLMARNLANHQRSDQPPILVYNRTVSKAQSLAEEVGPKKIVVATGPEQIVRECDIIITSLSNDTVIKAVYQEFAAALKSLNSGAPPAAHSAQLVIVMSGEVRAKREVAYLLVPAVGRKVIDLGSNVEQAPKLKIIGNSLILSSIEIIGEAMTLASKSDVGAENVANLIKDLFPCPSWLLYSDKILHDKFDGTNGFHLEGGLKDTTHIRSLAAECNSPMPVIDIAHQHLLTAKATHQAQGANAKHQTLDWSSVVAGSRLAAGLAPFDLHKASPAKVVDYTISSRSDTANIASRDENGEMWCPDCRKVESVVKDMFARSDKRGLVVYVGNKPEWKSEQNTYRRAFGVQNIPSIIIIENGKETLRASEDEILDPEFLQACERMLNA